MDPSRIAQRARHKQPKAAPPEPSARTPFQTKLHTNPYARLLATPVRKDRLAQASLPSGLLVDLDVKAAPRAPHRPHYVPSTLFAGSAADTPAADVRSPRVYVPLRREALRALRKKSRRVRALAGGPFESLGRGYVGAVVWREDMDELVLGLLRRTVERKMRWLLRATGIAPIVRCDGGAAEAANFEDVGCVIYVRSWKSEELIQLERKVEDGFAVAERLVDKARTGFTWLLRHGKLNKEEKTRLEDWSKAVNFPARINPAISNPPMVFTTVYLNGRSIPVYALEDLMGRQETEKLLNGTPFEDASCMIMKDAPITGAAQMWLLKLQAYLA